MYQRALQGKENDIFIGRLVFDIVHIAMCTIVDKHNNVGWVPEICTIDGPGEVDFETSLDIETKHLFAIYTTYVRELVLNPEFNKILR
jgi:hypothetical protein